VEPGEARKRCSVDVERVRLPVEEEACARLQASLGLKTLPYTPQDAPTRRRELLRSALLLTETMAPRAHAAARATREALGLLDEIEVFQSNGWDTARLALHGHPIGVEFMGGYMNALDIGGLTAVIGHEVGHACLTSTTPPHQRQLHFPIDLRG
jgi:hypothetical protein